MIIGRSRISYVCLFLLGGTLTSCGGGDGGVAFSVGGDASAISVSSSGGDLPGGNEGGDNGEDQETPAPSGPTFAELVANSAEADAFGTVIDSPVSGLRYKSGEHYGITDNEGHYGYIQGEPVEFFIGDISIGAAIEPVARVTPYELGDSNPQTAMNIARFLQTLDNDANPDNGIQINEAVHTLAEGQALDFTSSSWSETALPSLVLVDGEWVTQRPAVELLVFDLTSATEAGARDLLSADSAMLHLSSTFLQLIATLGEEAEAILSSSTCETDSQCQWARLSSVPTACPSVDKKLVYSEVNADFPAFELLEAQRSYLIGVRETLRESVWGPDRSTGSCVINSSPSWAICGETNRCEITKSLPIR